MGRIVWHRSLFCRVVSHSRWDVILPRGFSNSRWKLLFSFRLLALFSFSDWWICSRISKSDLIMQMRVQYKRSRFSLQFWVQWLYYLESLISSLLNEYYAKYENSMYFLNFVWDLLGARLLSFRQHMTEQGRIQDFPLGGRQPSLEGVPTSDTGAFWWNIYKNERIWSCWGGGAGNFCM